MPQSQRFSTGVDGLDSLLGGGLLPGTVTVAVGATGIGKTQLGIQFAAVGQQAEGHKGVILDMNARGDSQSHSEYAQRICDWQIQSEPSVRRPDLERIFDLDQTMGDYLHVFEYQGQRVTRRDMEFEQWQDWHVELNTKLSTAIGFLYGNFVRGARRAVVDGLEPVDRPGESIQVHLFEYIYHQILRKDPAWVARDLFREKFRENAKFVKESAYQPQGIACLLLYTSHENMLAPLIERPLDEGDLLSGANTVIYMGKMKEGQSMGRGLHVAKHRGSICDDRIVKYQITESGLQVDS